MVAPPWFAVPPPGYGGIERVVSYLTEGLVARGHDVTLFASGGSRTAAHLVSPFAEPPSAALGDTMVEAEHLVSAYASWRDFDLIHDHTALGLLAANTLPIPVVHTVHGPVAGPYHELCAKLRPGVHLVAISRSQRASIPRPATVVHNALDLAATHMGDGGGGYLLFVGRMSPEKGVLDAIEIAHRARMPLLMLAKINEPAERQYFDDVVKPALRGRDVDVLGQPGEDVKLQAFQRATATLFPIHWDEPFGLVMIESMAAGTPVVAYPRGAVPEVIVDGVTGFLCASLEAAVAAVARVHELSRAACREHVARNFSSEGAVERHIQLYRAALAEPGAALAAPAQLAAPVPHAQSLRSTS